MSFTMYRFVHTHVPVSWTAPIANVLEVIYFKELSIDCTMYFYMYDFFQRDDHITLKQSCLLTFGQKVFLVIKFHLIPRSDVKHVFSHV